jgi:hypothetical protein
VLKTCKGKVCVDPWDELLPGGGIATLAEAMNSKYDAYFAGLPTVSYSVCENGYIAASEGPMWDSSFGEGFDVNSMVRRGAGSGWNMWNRP